MFFIPLIWILYIIFKEKVLNFIYITIHKNFVYKKSIIKKDKSNYYKNKTIINEGKITDIEGISVQEDHKYLFKCQNSIFRLKNKLNDKQQIKGTCFICKIILNSINLETICLFTNYHVLPDIEEKRKNSSLKITLENDFKRKSFIEINEETNLIFCKSLDYVFIEIKKDMIKEVQIKEEKEQKEPIEININKENGIQTFFEIDPQIFKKEYKNNDYLGIEARLSGFPSGEENMIKEEGKIIEVDKEYDFKFYHNINTEGGNSGSPICKKNNSYLIGIHCAFNFNNKNNNNTIKNIGTFFKDILKDLHKKYIYNTIQNQPIFGGNIGYFCELKSINFCFLLVEYGVYEQYIKNRNVLEFDTILNEKKTIDLKLKRFIFPSNVKKIQKLAKEKNFAVIEVLKEDNINYFFHFNAIDEDIISKNNEKYKEYIESIKKKENKGEEEFLKEKIISKEDLFNSIEHSGYNVTLFQSFGNYTKEKKKMKNCYFKIQEKLQIFMNEIINNLFSQIDRKKYFPKYNYLKILIRIIIFILLILVHLIGFFKYDYRNKKKKLKNFH